MGSPARRSRTQALPKQARVRKRREFLQIQKAGKRVATRHFLVVHASCEAGPPRLGITVTKKIGNAVVRNRVKRAVRESFRTRQGIIAAGTSVVVIARDGAGDLSSCATDVELAPAFSALDVADAAGATLPAKPTPR